MKKISLYFQIHQPYRLREYRFFDIGNNAHYYFDDYMNEDIFQRIATDCYYPATRLLKELLFEHPDFKINFIISGFAIEQMEYYAPSLISEIKEMVETNRVELLVEPYAHSIACLYNEYEFTSHIKMMRCKLKELFNVEPKVFCNTELIYSDDIARIVSDMGFEGILTESAKHVLGWKSPNYIYSPSGNDKIKILLRNASISDLIVKDFSQYSSPNYPVTVEKVLDAVRALPENEKFVNLYMNYETLGVIHHESSGIFEFFKALPRIAKEWGMSFANASDIIQANKPIGELSVMYPISSSGEEKSVNEWTGNILQKCAISKLEQWSDRIHAIKNNSIIRDWVYIQSADHLYYMNTINNGGGEFSPYSSPYEAFGNYMNVLSDLIIRADKECPRSIDTEELNAYQKIISNQNKEIEKLKKEKAELEQKL